MTNAFRKESKLGEVKPNAALTAAARAFAEYLAKTGKFAQRPTVASRPSVSGLRAIATAWWPRTWR